MDTFTGAERFTFSSLNLADGIDFVPIAMGLFGLGEILYNLEAAQQGALAGRGRQRRPSRTSARPRARSGAAPSSSSVLGVLQVAATCPLVAYAVEKPRA